MVVGAYREGDIVWVQDYHLMQLPQLLKNALPKVGGLMATNLLHGVLLGRAFSQGFAGQGRKQLFASKGPSPCAEAGG